MKQNTAPAWYKTLTPRTFFIFWFIIGLIQAAGTGLLDDEAYYWVYAQFLDWGYYDHPPMTAVFIKAGTLLFPGELGVRFFIVLTNTATLWIIHKLLREKNDTIFYWIAAGMAVLQIGGVLAVPDLPMVFFIACFFYVYKLFLEKADTRNTILLGFVMACMLYSKYHGVLVVFFTLLSNPALFKKVEAWLAVVIASLLFVPHIIWQYQHNFPSVQYHLFERNATAYKLGFTLEYLGGQLALMGPIIGWLLLWAAWKYRPVNKFDAALRWNLFGILIFFGVSTIKGRVEANWTIPVFVPLIILSHQYLQANRRWWPFLRISAFITIVLVLALRLYMLADVDRLPWLKKDEVHKNKERALAIKEKAAGRPVIFVDSYQQASKHWFYSGDTALSVNTLSYRRNNYNFWPIEKQFQGRPVLWATQHIDRKEAFGNSIMTVLGEYPVYEDSCFYSRMEDWLDVPVKANLTGNTLTQSGIFSLVLDSAKCSGQSNQLYALILDGKTGKALSPTDFRITDFTLKSQEVKVSTNIPTDTIQNLQIRYGIPTSGPGVTTLNSRTIKVNGK